MTDNIDTYTVELSEAEFAVVCGLVQPSNEVNINGIQTDVWEKLRGHFQLENFKLAVAQGIIEYDEEAGT